MKLVGVIVPVKMSRYFPSLNFTFKKNSLGFYFCLKLYVQFYKLLGRSSVVVARFESS